MTAFVSIVDHPLKAEKQEQFRLPAGTRLDLWLAEMAGIERERLYDQPPVAVRLNGDDLPVDQWCYALQPGDRVLVLPRQFGWTEAIYAIVAAVVAYAAMPEVPEAQNKGDLEQSPSYSADAQGNRARLGSPIPVVYGDVRYWPDFAALPYRRYHNHDQYLYQLLSLGQGEHEYSDVRVGETPLSSFSEAEYRIYQPGEAVTLFPVAAIESDEVRDIQLFAPDEEEYADQPESPAYISSPAGTNARLLELDFVFPGGLYYMGSNGPRPTSVSVYVHIRPVDDEGAPAGPWERVADHTFHGDSTDVLRHTVSVPVSGRVEIKAERYTNTPAVDDYRQKTAVHWAGLRAFLDESPRFAHPVLALKMRVDDQLSNQSERKINLRLQRKLPIWSAAAGWSAPVVTRNPVWALCDAVKSDWGGKFGDDQLNLAELATVAQQLNDEAVSYDGIFDTKGKLWSALQQISSNAMAEPTLFGGVFSMRRDVQEIPEYHFGMADILPGSFNIEYSTLDEWGYDSVEIEYTDPVSWKPATVLCSVTASKSRPQTVKLPGCTDIELARKVGHRIAARREYRNRKVSWRTELNGRLPRYGDTVRVSHEYPQWGISGTVLTVYGDGRTLELSEPVAGGGWLAIPGPAGKLQGPWQVEAGDDEYHVVLPAGHGAEIRTATTHAVQFASTFAYAETAESIGLPVKLRSLRAVGEYTLELSGEYDAPAVYDPPVLDGDSGGTGGGSPERSLLISGLKAVQRGTLAQPELQLSWNPVINARGYRIEYAYAEGQWQAAGVAGSATYLLPVLPREVHVRVAVEVAEGLGPWSSLTVIAGDELGAPPAPENLALAEPFVGLEARFKWSPVVACNYVVEITNSSGQLCRTDEVKQASYVYTAEQARADGIGRGFTLRVFSVSKATGVYSIVPAELAVGNPAPPQLQNISVLAGAESIGVFFEPSSESDLAGYVVYYGPSPVTTGSQRMIVEGQTGYIQVPIVDDRVYRIRIGAFDAWGLDGINLSPETADVAAGIREGQLAASLRRDIERIPELDNALAGIRRDVDVVDDKANAYAQQIDTLQAGVEGDRQTLATVQTLQRAQGGSIENLAAMWTTRAVAGSSQAYVGLRAGHGDPSRVILGADEVAIGDASAQHFPFVVKDNRVYLADAMIGRASVGTLEIAGSAVTVPVSSYYPGFLSGSGVRDVRSVSINAGDGMIHVTFTCVLRFAHPGGDVSHRGRADIKLYVDGSLVCSTGQLETGWLPQDYGAVVSVPVSLSCAVPALSKFRAIKATVNGTTTVAYPSLLALGVKR